MRPHRLEPGQLHHFVTYLVETISVIGGDRCSARFPPEREERLDRLHTLIRPTYQDHQVRAICMSFAANQLAKVWLPEEVSSQEMANIREIRFSIRHAIKLAPWKFKLWRAALRAAVRRQHGVVNDTDPHQKATEWLESMIQWIAVDGEWSKASARTQTRRRQSQGEL